MGHIQAPSGEGGLERGNRHLLGQHNDVQHGEDLEDFSWGDDPNHRGPGYSTGHSSRLELLKQKEAAGVSWDRKRKGAVEDEDAPPLPLEEWSDWNLSFQQVQLRISAEEDAGETAMSRLKRQLNSAASG